MLLWHCCISWCSNETLLEMLIWRQWVFVLNSWVSWCFCDTVAPDVQMRLCWKCWFEGNEYLFLIPKSLDSFVTLLHLMFKWDFVGNVDVGAMSICSYSLSLLMLLWHCCTWYSNETLWEMLIWGQWVFVLNSWVSWCFCDAVAPDVQMGHCGKCWFVVMRPCSLFLSLLMLLWHCCTWCSNETLLEMLMWWQWVFVLNSWVSWCFCDTVAPDVQMSLCWKCWFEGNKSLFLNLSLLSLLWLCCTWCWNETLLEMLIWRQWVFVLNSWFFWCFCDSVAPDAQMRLCWKCWCEGNEYLFLIPESLDAFVTLLHLMFKWDFVGNVDLKAMSICS